MIALLQRFLYKQPRVFLSYRRAGSQDVSGRLADLLRRRFGRRPVFMDVSSIAPGQDFLNEVRSRIGAGIDTVLVIMGPGWADHPDPAGRRRLDNPEDPVRIEVEQALGAGARIIPVLIHGAEMPRVDELPESLRPLARRSALPLRHESFDDDARRLLEALRGPFAWGRILGVALLLTAVWLGWSLSNPTPVPPSPIRAEGRVIDGGGAPVANARVEIRRGPADSEVLASGDTDESGRLEPIAVPIDDPLTSVRVWVLIGEEVCYRGDHVLKDPIEVLLSDCVDSGAGPLTREVGD